MVCGDLLPNCLDRVVWFSVWVCDFSGLICLWVFVDCEFFWCVLDVV